ncbi:hypothetical protein scyTo_0019318 [Scyliorhinus torazame]|uniref:Uncharacterized protein n=1 Tax=Scyliorhinus torazame TaxID=75743 RepID=A0A401PX61_SCYTO|nr:hypothetical protein [Scyliorhinus torazame]
MHYCHGLGKLRKSLMKRLEVLTGVSQSPTVHPWTNPLLTLHVLRAKDNRETSLPVIGINSYPIPLPSTLLLTHLISW